MPSQLTAYCVFEETKVPEPQGGETVSDYYRRVVTELGGAWKPLANEHDEHGHFEERDHKGAIDLALVGRDAEARKGGFAAAPARNWREFDFSTEVEHVTSAVERTNGRAPAPEPAPA